MDNAFAILEPNTIFPITKAQALEHLKLEANEISEELLDLYIQTAYTKVKEYIGWSICPEKYRMYVNVKKKYRSTTLVYTTETLLYPPAISIDEVAVNIDDVYTVLEPTAYARDAHTHGITITLNTLSSYLDTEVRPFRIEYTAGYPEATWLATAILHPHHIIRLGMLEEIRVLYENCASDGTVTEKAKGILSTLRKITI